MPILVAILLGVLALAFVLYPLYEWGGREQGDRKGRPYYTRSERLLHSPVEMRSGARGLLATESQQTDREEAARAALREIELDFQLGNIGEAEYRSLHERYMRRAFLALKARHDREQEIDEEIEEQLLRMREKSQEPNPVERDGLA